MAGVFAPFIINRTIDSLTFYCMEGRNFVRRKSSLSRKQVLYSPQFEGTRHHAAFYNAALLARASKLGSKLYACVGSRYKCRRYYQQLTAWAMQWDEADILAELLPVLKAKQPEKVQQLSSTKKNTAGLIVHPTGLYYFIPSLYKGFDGIHLLPTYGNPQKQLYPQYNKLPVPMFA